MQDLMLSAVFAAIALALISAAVLVGRGEAAQRKTVRAAAPAATGGVVVQLTPEPPQTWVPFITAGALVALGLALLSNNIVRGTGKPIDVKVDRCTTRFDVPAEARTNDTVTAMLSSTCPRILASSTLYVNGTDKANMKVLALDSNGGTAYWSLLASDGIQHIMLLARPASSSGSGSLTIPSGAHSDFKAGSCSIHLNTSPATAAEYHTLDVSSPCAHLVGSERVTVDGSSSGGSKLGTLNGGTTQQWLVKSAGKPQRIDVIVDDTTQFSTTIRTDIRGKTPFGLGTAASFATGTLGSLTTLAGLIAGVLALFRRP